MVPLAPLPLSGWNTVPRPLVFTPPGWGFGRGGGCCPAGSPYGWGVPPAGKTTFSFVGERGVFYLTVGFLPTRLGAKTTFSFDSKEKAVLDSEKEKVDQWK